MAIDLTILKADRLAVIADIPLNVTYEGQTVSCRKSVVSASDKTANAGLLTEYMFSVHSVTADWVLIPAIGDLVTISAVEYRVLRPITDAVGTRLDLGAKYTDR